jgi:hypothetical protein
MEHLITAQSHLFVLGGSHTRPLDRHLLAHHHAVASFLTPSVGRPLRLRPTALTRHFPDFLVHQQAHQLQSSLANQFAHALS